MVYRLVFSDLAIVGFRFLLIVDNDVTCYVGISINNPRGNNVLRTINARYPVRNQRLVDCAKQWLAYLATDFTDFTWFILWELVVSGRVHKALEIFALSVYLVRTVCISGYLPRYFFILCVSPHEEGPLCVNTRR